MWVLMCLLWGGTWMRKVDGFVGYKGMKRRVSANLRTFFSTDNRGNRKRRLAFDF